MAMFPEDVLDMSSVYTTNADTAGMQFMNSFQDQDSKLFQRTDEDDVLEDLFPGLQRMEQPCDAELGGLPSSREPPSLTSSSHPTIASTSDIATQPSSATTPISPIHFVERPFPEFRQYDGAHPLQHIAPSGHFGLGICLPNQFSTLDADPTTAFNHQTLSNDPHWYGRHDSPRELLQQQCSPVVYTADVSGGTDADDESPDAGDESYAKLLHRCLMSVLDHTLPLKDIYKWVSQNSSKAKDPHSKGWQNSVRHNLSMNQAFEKVSPCPGQGPKKGGGGLWRLTDEAAARGVISTTRFRKETKKRHDRRIGTPAPKRQESGRRGGRATRDASLRNRREQELARARPVTSKQPHNIGHPFPSPFSLRSTASSPAMYEPSPSPMTNNTFSAFFPEDTISNRYHQPPAFATPAPSPQQGYQHPIITKPRIIICSGQGGLPVVNGGAMLGYDTGYSSGMPFTPDMTDGTSFFSDDGGAGFSPPMMSREHSVAT